MQGGEKIFAGSKTRGEDSKVAGKVFSSKVPTSKPIMETAGPITLTVVTTVPIMKPKGIMIGGSASKPNVDIAGSA